MSDKRTRLAQLIACELERFNLRFEVAKDSEEYIAVVVAHLLRLSHLLAVSGSPETAKILSQVAYLQLENELDRKTLTREEMLAEGIKMEAQR